MQGKLPLENKVLQAASAIDPAARGHSLTVGTLKSLKDEVGILTEEEEEVFDLEQVDANLPAISEELPRIDSWWAKIASSKKYNKVCKVVFAILSIFHGPQVESTFNTMGDVINKPNLKILA